MNTNFFQISSNSVVQGIVLCSSAAPAIAADARQAIFIALTNPSKESVKYAVYNNITGDVESKGTLSGGNSKAVIIPGKDTPNIVRIQNQSNCDASGVTPSFSYAASVQ